MIAEVFSTMTGTSIKLPLPEPRPMMPKSAMRTEEQFPQQKIIFAPEADIRTEGTMDTIVQDEFEFTKQAMIHWFRDSCLTDEALMFVFLPDASACFHALTSNDADICLVERATFNIKHCGGDHFKHLKAKYTNKAMG